MVNFTCGSGACFEVCLFACLACQKAWAWIQAESLAGPGKTWPCGGVAAAQPHAASTEAKRGCPQLQQRLSVAFPVRAQLPQAMGRERKAEGMVEGCREHRVATLHSSGGQGTGIVGSAEATTLRAAAGEIS